MRFNYSDEEESDSEEEPVQKKSKAEPTKQNQKAEPADKNKPATKKQKAEKRKAEAAENTKGLLFVVFIFFSFILNK